MGSEVEQDLSRQMACPSGLLHTHTALALGSDEGLVKSFPTLGRNEALWIKGCLQW